MRPVCCLPHLLFCFQFELVAELFTEEDNVGGSQGSSAAHGRKRTSSTSTQPIKAQPKGASKQHKKTVGSQVRSLVMVLVAVAAMIKSRGRRVVKKLVLWCFID